MGEPAISVAVAKNPHAVYPAPWVSDGSLAAAPKTYRSQLRLSISFSYSRYCNKPQSLNATFSPHKTALFQYPFPRTPITPSLSQSKSSSLSTPFDCSLQPLSVPASHPSRVGWRPFRGVVIILFIRRLIAIHNKGWRRWRRRGLGLWRISHMIYTRHCNKVGLVTVFITISDMRGPPGLSCGFQRYYAPYKCHTETVMPHVSVYLLDWIDYGYWLSATLPIMLKR